MQRIFPRSPRETMDGWVHLPRLIDKIRLHLAGKLHSDYQENFIKSGFDKRWLEVAGVDGAKLIEVVRASVSDGEVCDWVRRNVKRSEAEKAAHREQMFTYGSDSEQTRERLKMRKEQSGLSGRDDIKIFVDYIDADEGRL